MTYNTFSLLEEVENLPDVSTLNIYGPDDVYPNLGAVDEPSKKGKGKTYGQSSQTVENIPILDFFATIQPKWINQCSCTEHYAVCFSGLIFFLYNIFYFP